MEERLAEIQAANPVKRFYLHDGYHGWSYGTPQNPMLISNDDGLFLLDWAGKNHEDDVLDAVQATGSIPENFKLKDPKTGKGGLDPIYFKGLAPSADPKSILFACPAQNFNGKRGVVRVNGSVEHIPEDEYQAQIKAQGGGS